MLGTLEVSVGNGHTANLGGHRQRMVLAVLLLHAPHPVSTDALIDGVWGERPPPTARKTLQVYVSRLRQILGDGDIVGARDGYALQVAADEIDAVQFERLAANGRSLSEADPVEAVAVLREALLLWRGPAWGELAFEDALRADAARLHERKLAVLEDHLAASLAVGGGAELVGELRTLVAEHPLRERLRGLLMLALYREGQTAESLTVFEDGRRRLADELGADPGGELEAMHRRILQQDPSLMPRVRPGAAQSSSPPRDSPYRGSNPYKGLNPFREGDADDFFGRAQLVQDLLERMTTCPLLAVVGPSGSGKSSVVRAGLVPALRDGALEGSSGWRIAHMTPGAHPFAQLESALVDVAVDPTLTNLTPELRGDDLDVLRAVVRVVPEGGRLALVIDQFEELFLQLEDDAERDRFIRNLAEALEDPHSGLTVVTTLRADVLHLPMAHPRLGPMLVDGIVHVLPLTPAELATACVAPAARVGVTVDPELAGELVADVADHPGALPLFQYALTELFDRRRDDSMDLHGYRELGEVRGVVARRAEQTFAVLDHRAQAACRQVFLRLVALGPDGEVGRRRADRSELETLIDDAGAVSAVLERFGAARLLAFDRDETDGCSTVEVAHEALLRAWPRLQGWIEDSQDDLRVQRSVAAAIGDWEAAGRDDDYLLSGARLDLAASWLRQTALPPTAGEHAYVEASLARQEQERREEQARQERELGLERRAAGRLRQLVAVLAVATVVAGSLGAVALVLRGQAEQQADSARAAGELLRAGQLASTAVANRQVDPELSLLLALHAVNITSQAGLPIPDDIVESLHWALQARRVQFPGDPEVTTLTGPEGPQGVFLLPADELVALAQENVDRQLTPRECSAFFDSSACPVLPDVVPTIASSEIADDGGQRPLAGTRITLVGTFIGETVGGMGLEFEAFTERTGIEVEATSPAGLEGTLGDQVQRDRPPDVAFIAQPGAVASYAGRGELVDLSGYLDPDDVRTRMSDHLVSLVTVAADGTWPSATGSIYGLPVRLSNKSTVWYSVPAFERAGYEVPESYDELLALTEQIVADGLTPWCHAEGSTAAGWPGTDLIENLLLHDSLDDYDAWLSHDIPFDSPPLHDAFQRMSRLLLEPGHTFGGQATAATMFYQAAAAPLFDDPPGCVLYPQGSDAPGWFPFGVEPGRDVAVFPFPPVTTGKERLVMGGGDFAMAFTDRPEVREFVRFLASEGFGERWARADPSFMSAHEDFPVEAYVSCRGGETPTCVPDPFRQTLAPPLTEALQGDRFRFDGSDLLPHGMGLRPMWDAMVEFVGAGPDNLGPLLRDLEATWVQREQEAAP